MVWRPVACVHYVDHPELQWNGVEDLPGSLNLRKMIYARDETHCLFQGLEEERRRRKESKGKREDGKVKEKFNDIYSRHDFLKNEKY